MYPFKFFQGFSQVDPLEIIQQPVAFSILFSVFVASFVLLAHLNREKRGVIAFYVLTTSLLFGLLTYKMEPFGVDHEYGITLTDTAYLAIFHHFSQPLPANVGYLEYPGISLLTYPFAKILGVSYQLSASFLQTSFYLVTGSVVYEITSRVVKQNTVTALSIPLFFAFSLEAGNLTLFFPAALGVTLFSSFLLLVKPPFGRRSLVPAAVLFAGMTISHFYDPLDAVFIIAAMTLPMFFGRVYTNLSYYLLVFFTIYVAYFTYFAMNYFGSLVPGVYNAFLSILSGNAFGYAFKVASANTLGVPAWVATMDYFDIVLTSIMGSLLALGFIVLKRRKWIRQHTAAAILSVGSIGVVAFGLTALLASLGSGGGFDLLIAPQFVVFFSIPFLLYAFSKNKVLVASITVIAITLCAPSMFALTYHQISTIAVYPEEIASASYFLKYQLGNLVLSTDPKTAGIIGSMHPETNFNYYQEPMLSFPYSDSSYNIIYPEYSYYQQHLYGYPIQISVIYQHDLVFDDGKSYLLPPAF
jgi:hypothetical protein